MENNTSFLRNQKWLVITLILACCVCAVLGALVGVVVNVVVIGLILAICTFYLTYTHPQYSLVIMLAGVFLLPLLIKVFYLGDVPVGTVIEGINGLLVFTLIIKGRFSGWKNWPGILMLVWLALNFVELLNPNATSRIAGIFALRGSITAAIAFFVAYSAVQSKKDIYFFFKWWVFFGLMAALYGLYQEFVGLPSHDLAWASYDENRYNLLFTWGHMRKFSFFNGPTEFGLVMAYTGIACFVMMFLSNLSLTKRIILAVVMVTLFWAMVFSGSRTATIMLPLGVVIVAAITLWKRVFITLAFVGALGLAFIFRPISSQSLFIMLTAFQMSEDASMNVRLQNQNTIRAYIQRTPLGFGLGSTGDLGVKYSPDSFIGTFPPDSELVKIGIETGWVGLFIWCVILATILGYGINAYFTVKDKELKELLLVPLTAFFMMIIAQYPQECFRAPVLALLFSFMAGFIARIKAMDDETRELKVKS